MFNSGASASSCLMRSAKCGSTAASRASDMLLRGIKVAGRPNHSRKGAPRVGHYWVFPRSVQPPCTTLARPMAWTADSARDAPRSPLLCLLRRLPWDSRLRSSESACRSQPKARQRALQLSANTSSKVRSCVSSTRSA